MASTFDVVGARRQFPALETTDQIYFDNAGGSQILKTVIDSITTYLSSTNVQLGASYGVGKISTRKYSEGLEAAAKYVNASPDEIVIGSSTTQIFRNLSFALQLNPGEEIIVSKLDHEANIACWEQLASWKGLALKWWAPASVPVHNAQLDLGELESLLSAQTKLVTCTHASNLLGTINAIGEAAAIVHGTFPDARTMLCVDGVALAPHRPLDLPRLGADFYCFSWYKVYGPHIAMLYASPAAQAQMASLGHYFKPARTLEDKIGLAGASYELVQSIPAVVEYLGGSSREAREERWRGIIAHEAVLQKIILDFLKAREGVTIFGDERADAEVRVPVISFTVDGWTPDDIVKKVESRSKIGFRSGHMYSKRLCNDILGLPGDEGVVRVSLVHYNTEEEVKEFVKVLDDVFSGK